MCIFKNDTGIEKELRRYQAACRIGKAMRRETWTETQLKLNEVMTTPIFSRGSEACVSRSKGGTGLKSKKLEGG
jgi:hypothetical protein